MTSEGIPPYLNGGKPVFIKLAHNSKAPKKGNSAKDGPFYEITDEEIQKHVDRGGNVGRVLRDRFIAIDVDHQTLLDELADWPDTLVIESGGDGLGFHYYYQVPGWDTNQKELTTDGLNIGSVRSGNSYCLVPPSRHDETNEKYLVSNPRNAVEISASRLSSLIEKYSTANTGSGGSGGRSAGRRPGVGGAGVPLPDEYPNREVGWKTAKMWLQSNGFLTDLNRSTCPDWSGLEFKLAKCLAEGGFSESVISGVLDRLHHNAKWHRKGENYRNLTVQKAIESAVSDPYVEFDTLPNDGEVSGSDLPEGKQNRSVRMSGNDSSFESKESVVKHNSDGKAVQARLMQGTDGESGETFEYVDVATGNIEETETVDGDTVRVPQINDGPGESDSLGSPESLSLKIEALQELQEHLD